MLDNFRKEGYFMFNKSADVNKGELLVSRRLNQDHKKNATDYSDCAICIGYYTKRTRNCNNCSSRKNKDRWVLALGRLTADRIHHVSNINTRIVVSRMREDNVIRIIRYDQLLMCWCDVRLSFVYARRLLNLCELVNTHTYFYWDIGMKINKGFK